MPLLDTPSLPVLDLFGLKGQIALVTGASRGIGASIAIALAQAGARVVLAQRDVSNTDTRDAIVKLGGKADIIPCDLAVREDAEKVVERALKVVDHFDILINNGGMLQRCDSVDVTNDDWDQVMNVNLNSLFVICRAAGKHFIPRKSGNIINIASLNSYIGGSRVVSYSAAKGAVSTVTKALSNEWSGYNIRVNAIAPGSVATNINTVARQDPAFVSNRLNGIPGGRWGVPEDFMGPAVFLASRASAYISGEMLVVDGGAMAKGPI